MEIPEYLLIKNWNENTETSLLVLCVFAFMLYFSWCIHMGSNLGIISTSRHVVVLYSETNHWAATS